MIKLAEHPNELAFGSNDLAEVLVRGKRICVARAGATKPGDRMYACAATCPHAGGRMAGGWLDERGNIVCPLHRYQFSLANGRNVSGEGYHLKTWTVIWNEEGVWLEMP